MFRCHAFSVSERLYWPVSVVHCVTDQIIAEEAPLPIHIDALCTHRGMLGIAQPLVVMFCHTPYSKSVLAPQICKISASRRGCMPHSLSRGCVLDFNRHPTPNQVWGRK